MNERGIVRRIDELGRIVVPKPVRDLMGWTPGTRIEFRAGDNGEVILRRADGLTIGELMAVLEDVHYYLTRHARGKPVDWDRLRREIARVLGIKEEGV